MSKTEHIKRRAGSISLTRGGEIVGEMGEHGRKVFSHAGSDTYPCFPEPKTRLVSGSEELEKLAGAARGRLVCLPAFPRSACLRGLPSAENALHLHLNKKLEPETVLWGMVGRCHPALLCVFWVGNLQLSSSVWLSQLEPTASSVCAGEPGARQPWQKSPVARLACPGMCWPWRL